jgi:hypothetical protein
MMVYLHPSAASRDVPYTMGMGSANGLSGGIEVDKRTEGTVKINSNAPSHGHDQRQIHSPFSTLFSPTHGQPLLDSFQSLQVPHAQSHDVNQRSMEKQAITRAEESLPTSGNNHSDSDEDAKLPATGLVALWEVLRGLADVTTERAEKVGSHIFS